MDPGHQLLDVAVFDHQPVVSVGILGFLEAVRTVHGEELTTSACISSNPCPVGGLKQTPAWPEQDIPAALCKVIEAEGRAKSASRSDWTGFVRPRMVLSNPISGWWSNSRGPHQGVEEGGSRRTT